MRSKRKSVAFARNSAVTRAETGLMSKVAILHLAVSQGNVIHGVYLCVKYAWVQNLSSVPYRMEL